MIIPTTIRRYDDSLKKIILNEEYLFAFLTTDGLSHRQLWAEFLIDYDYNLVLNFSCDLPTSKEYVFKEFSETITEKASSEIIYLLEDLLNSDYLELNEYYDFQTFQVDDIGGQQFLINFHSPTFNIHIVNGLPGEHFKSATERKLFQFNKFLLKIVETKYQNLLGLHSV
jgi:hypothetical protein